MRLLKIASMAIFITFLVGCAIEVPPPRAGIEVKDINWGALGKFIGAEYASANDTLRVIDSKKGTLHIQLIDGERPRTIILEVTPGQKPETYYVKAINSGILNDYAGLVYFDKNGRMHQIEGNLGFYNLTITDSGASFYNPYLLNLESLKRVPDTYTLDNGKAIPVSNEPESPLRKLHDSLPGYGLWETKIGQTLLGDIDLLRIEKTQAGDLRLLFMTLEEKNLLQLTFSKSMDTKGSTAQFKSSPPVKADKITFNQTELEMQFSVPLANRGGYSKYVRRLFIRGDRIINFSSVHDSDKENPSLFYRTYGPLTENGMIAAMQQREKFHRQQAKDAAYEEQRALERAEERRATERSIISGLNRGFAQAQQSNDRLNQMSQNFERNLNNDLQKMKSDQDKQREAAKAAAAQLIASNNAAKLIAPSASITGSSAQAGSEATSNKAEPPAQRQKAEQRQNRERQEEERRASQKMASEKEKRIREDAANQDKLKQQQALKNHLAAEKNGIRLRATSCPGGGGYPSVIGTRPSITPKVAQCLIVHFEALCPGERPGTGVRGTVDQFQGSGSCFDSSQPMPRKLACDVSQAMVSVTNVSSCP
nr:hypothetical protein [Comamonas thiooxydans]